MVRRVQTVEQTGKVWKLQMLMAAFLGIFCLVAFAVLAQDDRPLLPEQNAALVLGCVVAGLWWLFARIGAWWYHG